MSSISAPNSRSYTSYPNNVTEHGVVINDDDDISTQNASMCIICHKKPPYSKGGRSYPTCGLTCASILQANGANAPSHDPRTGLQHASRVSSYVQNALQSRGAQSAEMRRQRLALSSTVTSDSTNQTPAAGMQTCVICLVKPCCDTKFVTCGRVCTEELCKNGSQPNTMCDYCHRKPKLSGYNQCGITCQNNAKAACLLCKSRPKFGRYHLCGQTCKQIATKGTPLILEAPPGHSTYDLVEQRFKRAWIGSRGYPAIKKIYKVIENESFLMPYDRYKRLIGNEVFRYHGTRQTCSLGAAGNNQLCSSTSCSLCSILRTSFKISLARPSGLFGPGIYSSSAANKACGYSIGPIILTKVVLGKVYDTAQAGLTVRSCPTGYNSVVHGANSFYNESIVYTDDAIRPVFLIFI